MISYRRFWDTMRRAGESTYTLTKQHRISSSTLDKLRKDKRRPVRGGLSL